ncbi:MAG: glutaminase [Bacteroidota bacterium]
MEVPNYQHIIEQVYHETLPMNETGEVAQYIPELSGVDPNQFGIHISSLDQQAFGIGDYQTKFSVQSISKVFLLALAYDSLGERLWRRVGVEPSGTPFNSLVQLEHDQGIPRNPMINAGAIVICDILISNFEDPKAELMNFIQQVCESKEVTYNNGVAISEEATGYRNHALINLMKSFGNIQNNIADVLSLYFFSCALEMTCEELSKSFLFLANDGINPLSERRVLSLAMSKRINAVMQTCGFYDEAGEFSFRVGLPGKSGVGGGIVAVHPEYFAISVWSPKLNAKGNSHRGLKFLEQFTTVTGQSVF